MVDITEFLKRNREEQIGVGFSVLRKYEKGTTEPSWVAFCNLAKLFGYNVVFTNGKNRVVNPDFGDFVHKQRTKRNMTQEELSLKTGSDTGQVSNYEQHKVVNPRWIIVISMIGVFGYEVEVEKA